MNKEIKEYYMDRLGYDVEWQCLNSKDFGVPQSRNRVYIVGYLDERCRGKVFPFTETTGGSLIPVSYTHLDVYKRQVIGEKSR